MGPDIEHVPGCDLLEEPWYMFDTKCTCQCTCKTDPFTCARGLLLVANIIKRKNYRALDDTQELGSDDPYDEPFRKLGKNVRTPTGECPSGSGGGTHP